ncbi:MAG: hypothetical protein A4E42_00305 [Methanoregulaceae archaeon PtaU1.Bin222]|nr:MAG: hypothetical protein A4E42_00305 [Methanoregulaceae archaeon PtaU1.Bin222]
MTVFPLASMVFALEEISVLLTILPSFMAMSALSPLIPCVGSKTKPFLIRYSDIYFFPPMSWSRRLFTRFRNSTSVSMPSGGSTTFRASIGTLSIR